MCKISEITFFPIRPTEKGLIGFASCVFNDQLALNCIAVYTKPRGDGIRCVFPCKRLPNGRDVFIFNPLDKNTTQEITLAIESKIKDVFQKVEGEMIWKQPNYQP